MILTRFSTTFMIIGIFMIAGIIGIALFNNSEMSQEIEGLKKFSSEEEIAHFIDAYADRSVYPYYYDGDANVEVQLMETGTPGSFTKDAALIPFPEGAQEYSTTNVQIEGVDEADFVKNNGKYIFLISGDKLVIVDAYPAGDARIVSITPLIGSPVSLFVQDKRVVVFSTRTEEIFIQPKSGTVPVPIWRQMTHATIFSVRNPDSPEIIRDIRLSGSYYDARMIGDYVYTITQEPVRYYHGRVPVPEISDGELSINPDIYYADIPGWNFVYHTISSFDLLHDDIISAESFLLGYGTTLYASTSHLYLAYQRDVPGYFDGPMPVSMESPPRTAERLEEVRGTIIHRFALKNGDIKYVATGDVPGYLLNQFAMDEYNGNLRVSTTVEGWTRTESYRYSAVYVLNEDMDTIGSLLYIAPGEQIYATRFIGNKLYMVTFKRIDPFFVIDLSDPSHPGILGKLKIPGYSDYLHPYDRNHIIGIGKETEENQWGGISVEGLKIALFDVTDVNNPIQVDMVEIGEPGSDSEVLRDHKAFLFDKEKNLLVIPVREVQRMMPPADTKESFSQNLWQGAYVFGINPETGFLLKGTICHEDGGSYGYWWDSSHSVRRALYIDNVLYTISSQKILLNSLEDPGRQLNSISLPFDDETPYPYPLFD